MNKTQKIKENRIKDTRPDARILRELEAIANKAKWLQDHLVKDGEYNVEALGDELLSVLKMATLPIIQEIQEQLNTTWMINKEKTLFEDDLLEELQYFLTLGKNNHR